MALGTSSGRTDMEALAFMRKVLPLCAGDPAFPVDRGPWHKKAFKRLGLRFQQNPFPHRSSIDSTRVWTNAFRSFYQLDRRTIGIEEVLS